MICEFDDYKFEAHLIFHTTEKRSDIELSDAISRLLRNRGSPYKIEWIEGYPNQKHAIVIPFGPGAGWFWDMVRECGWENLPEKIEDLVRPILQHLRKIRKATDDLEIRQ